jgi:DnaJ-class molecular chaperone
VTTEATPCKKCGGRGFIPEYARRERGECYRCHGTGREGAKPRYTLFGEPIVEEREGK